MSIAPQRLPTDHSQGAIEEDMRLLRHVGHIVRKHRTSNNLEVADLSSITGVSHETIFGLESGMRDIDFDDLLSIADALGVSAVDLVDMTLHPQ